MEFGLCLRADSNADIAFSGSFMPSEIFPICSHISSFFSARAESVMGAAGAETGTGARAVSGLVSGADAGADVGADAGAPILPLFLKLLNEPDCCLQECSACNKRVCTSCDGSIYPRFAAADQFLGILVHIHGQEIKPSVRCYTWIPP